MPWAFKVPSVLELQAGVVLTHINPVAAHVPHVIPLKAGSRTLDSITWAHMMEVVLLPVQNRGVGRISLFLEMQS
jgi:hypothetical protein